jgi:hypothetical protein
MELVTEISTARFFIREIVFDRLCLGMTLVAILLYGKRLFTVMAGTA